MSPSIEVKREEFLISKSRELKINFRYNRTNNITREIFKLKNSYIKKHYGMWVLISFNIEIE